MAKPMLLIVGLALYAFAETGATLWAKLYGLPF